MAYVKINDEHLTNYANSIRQAKNNNKHYTPEQLEDEIQGLAEKTIEQETTITRQNNTIDQLNHREPKLETLDPINPSTEQVTYRPSGDNVGFNPFTVNPPTAEGLGFDYGDLKKDVEFLGGVGTYNPMTNLADFINGVQSIVNIPEGTTTIANPNLLNADIIVFPKSINNISNRLFESNNKIKSVLFEEPSRLATISQLAFAYSTIQSVLLPRGINSIAFQAFRNCDFLKTIFFPKSLANIDANAFAFNSALEFVTLENGFNCNNLNLSASTLYSVETILSWFNALADRTGQTAYTLTIGATNLAKMTAEEIAIATNKNWNIA